MPLLNAHSSSLSSFEVGIVRDGEDARRADVDPVPQEELDIPMERRVFLFPVARHGEAATPQARLDGQVHFVRNGEAPDVNLERDLECVGVRGLDLQRAFVVTGTCVLWDLGFDPERTKLKRGDADLDLPLRQERVRPRAFVRHRILDRLRREVLDYADLDVLLWDDAAASLQVGRGELDTLDGLLLCDRDDADLHGLELAARRVDVCRGRVPAVEHELVLEDLAERALDTDHVVQRFGRVLCLAAVRFSELITSLRVPLKAVKEPHAPVVEAVAAIGLLLLFG